MRKYKYKYSSFGRIRQEKAKFEKKVTNKVYKVNPWKVYAM